MTKFEFQPFDKVLVRDFDNQSWKADLFSHEYVEDGDTFFACMGNSAWLQCIPYNETTKHLCGTSDPYIAPAEAPAFEFGDVVSICSNEFIEKGIFLYPNLHEKVYVYVLDRAGSTHSCRMAHLRLIRKGNFND